MSGLSSFLLYLCVLLFRALCIVFDAKQSRGDDGSRFDHRGITVRFAYEQEEADDLLEILIAADPHPDRLLVVTSDRRVQTAAMRRNAEVIGSEAWLEQLQSRVDAGTSEVSVQKSRDDPRQHQPDSDETQRWLDEFALFSVALQHESLDVRLVDTRFIEPDDRLPPMYFLEGVRPSLERRVSEKE